MGSASHVLSMAPMHKSHWNMHKRTIFLKDMFYQVNLYVHKVGIKIQPNMISSHNESNPINTNEIQRINTITLSKSKYHLKQPTSYIHS